MSGTEQNSIPNPAPCNGARFGEPGKPQSHHANSAALRIISPRSRTIILRDKSTANRLSLFSFHKQAFYAMNLREISVITPCRDFASSSDYSRAENHEFPRYIFVCVAMA
jgi:hypothetical protein